jgi:hypothetical protein
LYESFWDKITSEQSKIFFTKLAEFRRKRRRNKELISNKTYIAFVEKSEDEDFLKLLDIEWLTINKNLLEKELLEAIFKRLLRSSFEVWNPKHLLKRINSIRDKILEKKWLSKLDNELENSYLKFIETHKKNKLTIASSNLEEYENLKARINNLIENWDEKAWIRLLEENINLFSLDRITRIIILLKDKELIKNFIMTNSIN